MEDPVLGEPVNATGNVLYKKLSYIYESSANPSQDPTLPSLSSEYPTANQTTSSPELDFPGSFLSSLSPLILISSLIVISSILLFICIFCAYKRCRTQELPEPPKSPTRNRNPLQTLRRSFANFHRTSNDSSASEIGYNLEHLWTKSTEPSQSGHITVALKDGYSEIFERDLEKLSWQYSKARLASNAASVDSSSSGSQKVDLPSDHKNDNMCKSQSTSFPKNCRIYGPASNLDSQSQSTVGSASVKRHLTIESPRSKTSTRFFHIPYEDVTLLEIIGSGNFGDVWHAKWNGAEVAMKQVSRGHKDELLEESKMLLQMSHHPHVCQLFGLTSKGNEMFIVQNYYPHGSVADYFKEHKVPYHLKLGFIKQACMGIEFLHQNKVVHRDIAARNLLVNGSLQVCVSDFGLARKLSDKCRKRTTTQFGPVRWMAIESIRKGEYSTMSDVWMLAVAIWEILSECAPPWGKLSNYEVVQKVSEGCCLTCQSEWDATICALLVKCWVKRPKDRPVAKVLRKFFEDLYDSCDERIEIL